MRKARAFFLILALGLGFVFGPTLSFLHAQEQEEQEKEEEPGYDEGEIPFEPDWDGYMPDLYSKGDQTITISLGTIFPTVFFNNGTPVDHNFSPPVGGALSLAYTHFLGAHLYLGGEISFNFNNTLAKNTVYLVPIGLRAGYQFVLRRFEFPLTMTVGVAPQRYLNLGYIGFFMKGGASAFFRFNPDWSFGLNVDWGWYPQWPQENKQPVPEKNMDANIIGLTISARYHF